MADLALRFGKDMLVVSSPIQEALRRAGIESVCDQALALLVEPETIEEAYRMETVAGPQSMVTPVADFTPARLVAVGAEGKGEALAEAALAVMAEFKPQHTLVEIAPCGLPLDPDSKASLVENRDQYARAAQFFDGRTFDAFFLNGFTTADDLKCALMGLRKVTDAPIIASVDVQGDGMLASGRGICARPWKSWRNTARRWPASPRWPPLIRRAVWPMRPARHWRRAERIYVSWPRCRCSSATPSNRAPRPRTPTTAPTP